MEFSEAGQTWTLEFSSCNQRGAPSRLHIRRHGKAVAPSTHAPAVCTAPLPRPSPFAAGRGHASLRSALGAALRSCGCASSLAPCSRSPVRFPTPPLRCLALRRSAARSRRGATPLSSTALAISQRIPQSPTAYALGIGSHGQALAATRSLCSLRSPLPARTPTARMFASGPNATAASITTPTPVFFKLA